MPPSMPRPNQAEPVVARSTPSPPRLIRSNRWPWILLVLGTSLIWLGLVSSTASEIQAAPPGSSQTATTIIRVPGDAPDLQTAIEIVPAGGIIELQAGTYVPPQGGFRINNKQRSFTIRAAPGANVVLDGQRRTDILRLQNTSRDLGGLVIFQGLTFANGFTTEDGVAGGVTIHHAEALFQDCRFVGNTGNQPTTGGGAVLVALNSGATFVNCTFENNKTRNEGAAIAANKGHLPQDTVVTVSHSVFRDNGTNVADHRNSAAGGAIHIGNAILIVTNTTFERNTSCIGGAIFAIGDWVDGRAWSASVTVTNSTFQDNWTAPAAGRSCTFLEGGAIHVEDATLLQVTSSRFIRNHSDIGGALNSYRAEIRVERAYFEGNYASGQAASRGFGGAIAAASNDVNNASTAGGTINRPSAIVTVIDSVFRGVPATASQTGDGIYIAGDANRTYGLGGVSQMGSVEENRARLTVQNSLFLDTDVAAINNQPGSGVGGAITADLAQVNLTDVIIAGADARGSNNASGGAIALLNNSSATMDRLTVVDSSSDGFGGALFVQGSHIQLSNCLLAENEISPGVNETNPTQSFGAAIFTGPDTGRNLPVTGEVRDCIIANNIGQPIYDDDRTDGPINAVQYNGNRIHTTFPGGVAYTNSIAFQCCKTVTDLNALVIQRNNGTSTDKSVVDNIPLATPPSAGALLAIPGQKPLSLRENYFLGYAWTGKQATLDGTPLSSKGGAYTCQSGCAPVTAAQAQSSRTHTLQVDGVTYTVKLTILDREIFVPVVHR